MKVSFYVLEDFRQRGVSEADRSFPSVQDALAHYRSLPADAAKELGMRNNFQAIPLIRRVAAHPGRAACENVLVTDRLIHPPWRGAPEVLTAARKCVSSLKFRYCLDRDRLVPKPVPPPDDLSLGGFGPPAVRRVYIAAVGWLSPAELERRFPKEGGAFSYPLVLKYLADVQTDSGPRTVELTHWNLRRMEIHAGTVVGIVNK